MSTPALNPLVTKIRAAYPSAYNDMDDAALTKAVLAKYPQYSDLAAPGIPRPPVPQELQRDTSLTGIAGERVMQNINLIPDVLEGPAYSQDLTRPAAIKEAQQERAQQAAGTRQMVFGNATTPLGKTVNAAMIGPRMAINMAKQYYHEPGTLLGDIATMAPELADMHLPAPSRPTTAPAPPRAMPELPTTITPEAQAAHEAALNKASTQFRENAIDYNKKLNEQFDVAKREQIEGSQVHAQKIKQINDQHAADVAQAKAEYDQAIAKEQAAREAHESKVQAAQRRQSIVDTQQTMAEDTRQRAQQVFQAERQELDGKWNAMRDGQTDEAGNVVKPGIKEAPGPVASVVDALNKAETEYLRGSPGSVTKFRQLADELGLGDMAGVADDADAATTKAGQFYEVNPDMPTAPWQTIRTHASAINRAMASGDLGNVYPAMKLVRDALENVAGKVAEQNGWGEEYRATRAQEAQFRKDFEDLGPISLGRGNPAARLVRAPNAAYALDVINGKGSDLLADALTRHDKTGALAQNIQQMRDLQAELKSLGQAKMPPAYAGQAPTMRAVPEPTYPEAPAMPEKKPPEAPEYPQVAPAKRTPVPPPKGGFLRRQVVPRVAGVAAAKVNLPFPGHPIVNYEAGKEMARAGMEKIAARRAMPSPPLSEQTRIILRAKGGEISPGEADRQISRIRGNVRVRPIPRPPQEKEK